jgi:hypothetical protein
MLTLFIIGFFLGAWRVANTNLWEMFKIIDYFTSMKIGNFENQLNL